MIRVEIPGRDTVVIDEVVFDYNGTIAVDGMLSDGLVERFKELKKHVKVRVLTADTFGTVRSQCEPIGIIVETFPRANAADCKEEIVKGLGENVCCIGNGYNDQKMFKLAKLTIGIMGTEGIYAGLISLCDIVVKSPVDAIDLLLKTDRLKATLRS